MNNVILGLGSNVGDKESYIDSAISHLADHDMIEIKQMSSLFENPAQTPYPQPDFLNACIEIQTFLTPEELLDLTESIEKKLDRRSKGGQDPRTIDIDIIFYGDEIITTDRLMVPHPLMHTRDFVLKPLLDIAKDWVHPLLQQRVDEMVQFV